MDDVYEMPNMAQQEGVPNSKRQNENKPGSARENGAIKLCVALLVVLLILQVVQLGISGVNVSNSQAISASLAATRKQPPNTETTVPPSTTHALISTVAVPTTSEVPCTTYYESCLALRTSGAKRSGYHVIRPANGAPPVQVFCDMETNGGGWTLVASINEDDFNQTCSNGDMWMSRSTSSSSSIFDYRNWENRYSFGSAQDSTKQDYKSSAYYMLKSGDVMIRHVPNQTPTNQSLSDAFLQYYTTNKFLQSYGGNLHSLYRNNFPLQPRSAAYFDITKLLGSLEAQASNLTAMVPGFYNYTFGNEETLLRSLPFTTYGAHIQFISGCGVTLKYEREVKCPTNNIITSSKKSKPFFALVGYGNFERKQQVVTFTTTGYRPVSDRIDKYDGNVTDGNFFLKYKAFCRYNVTRTSLCDVFFLVKNTNDWNSWEENGWNLILIPVNGYYKTGINSKYCSWSNVILGYTLLARGLSNPAISKPQVDKVMTRILRVVATTPDIKPPCLSNADGLVVPVSISLDKNASQNLVPSPLVGNVKTGFLQLRSYGYSGDVYALCPYVRADTCMSKYVCIGGVIGNISTQTANCNDLTGWNGADNSAYAHSQRDIQSTMMIFYR